MPVTTTNTCLIACFDGLADGITPTANFSPVVGFPLANVGNSQLFSRTRTAGLTDQQMTWDLGISAEINAFVLAGTNATSDVLGQLQAADDAAFTVGLVNVHPSLVSVVDTSLGQSRATYVPPWGRTLAVILSTSITKQYYRWRQTDTTNPDGYMEWGLGRFGLALQLPFDSWRAGPKPSGPVGSQKIQRGHELTYPLLTRDQAYDVESIALTSLNSRRMLVIPEPLRPETFINDALWCTFEGVHVREPIAGTSNAEKRWRVTLTFREAER